MSKLVKGATKPKEAAPKAKYIEPILATTFDGGRNFEEVIDSLTRVLSRGQAWTSYYKALIVLHIMIREGAEDVTLRYMSRHPRMLDLDDHAHRAVGMGKYARYLATRAQQYKDVRFDDVRFKDPEGHSRLFRLPAQKTLLKGCESVIVQLDALIKCHYEEVDVSSDVILMAFRLLVHDCLTLFQVLNEGVINVLEHYFELNKSDAEQALDIYRGFTRLTTKVIAYLRTAKHMEYKTKLHVPNIKHAPTSLVSTLEMYLNDPDFEINRRQYLAEKQAHEVKRSASKQSRRSLRAVSAQTQPAAQAPASTPAATPANVPAIAPQAQPVVSQQVSYGFNNQPQPAQAMQPDSNPFWQQNNELSQQEALAQVQAARIQLQEGQAALQMQQLQFQQQQQAQVLQQQQLQQQYTSQFNQNQFAQPQVPQPHPQPQQQTQAPQIQPVNFEPPPAQQTSFDAQFDAAFNGQQLLYAQPTGPQQQIQPQPQQQQSTGWPDFEFGQSSAQPQHTQSFGSVQSAPSIASQPTTPPSFGASGGQDSYAHNPFKRVASVSVASDAQHNPFARRSPPAPQATGTNPFRLSSQ